MAAAARGRGATSGDPGTGAVSAPPAPPTADAVFGAHRRSAERFVALLADTGISHGLVGPREAPRLWDRHLLNCAVVHPAFPRGARVADVGSGAGLPGLALAIVRPDLHLELIEPLKRRTTWLRTTVAALGLANVTVREGRAEAFWDVLSFPFVTARAVAPLGDLARLCLPLLAPGGSLIALKGAGASAEVARERAGLERLGAILVTVESFGEPLVDPPTVVVRVDIGAVVPGRRPARPLRPRGRPTGS